MGEKGCEEWLGGWQGKAKASVQELRPFDEASNVTFGSKIQEKGKYGFDIGGGGGGYG